MQSGQVRSNPKILNYLCDLRVLCGEILLENGIGFHEISYEVSGLWGAHKYRKILGVKKEIEI
jgi:hypothetical protein